MEYYFSGSNFDEIKFFQDQILRKLYFFQGSDSDKIEFFGSDAVKMNFFRLTFWWNWFFFQAKIPKTEYKPEQLATLLQAAAGSQGSTTLTPVLTSSNSPIQQGKIFDEIVFSGLKFWWNGIFWMKMYFSGWAFD